MRAAFRTITVALLLALAPVPGGAQTPFFQGKQLKVLVGFPPGGGTDLYARVIADGLARHMPGKPTVVVQNQPGAGSVIAARSLVVKDVPPNTLYQGTVSCEMRPLHEAVES